MAVPWLNIKPSDILVGVMQLEQRKARSEAVQTWKPMQRWIWPWLIKHGNPRHWLSMGPTTANLVAGWQTVWYCKKHLHCFSSCIFRCTKHPLAILGRARERDRSVEFKCLFMWSQKSVCNLSWNGGVFDTQESWRACQAETMRPEFTFTRIGQQQSRMPAGGLPDVDELVIGRSALVSWSHLSQSIRSSWKHLKTLPCCFYIYWPTR